MEELVPVADVLENTTTTRALPTLVPGPVSEVPKAKVISDHNSAANVVKPETSGKSKKAMQKDTSNEESAVLSDDGKAKKGCKVSSMSCSIYLCNMTKSTWQAGRKVAKAKEASGLSAQLQVHLFAT
jgi:hypothetical protein